MPRTAAVTPRSSRRSPRDVSASPSGTHSPSKRPRARSPAGNQAKSPTKRTRTTSSSPSLPTVADGFPIAGSSSPAADGDHLPGGDPRSSGNVDAPPSGADEALSSDGSFALVEAVRDDSVRQLLRQLLIDKQSLQGELADLKSKADKREQVRAYEEGAPTGFSHDRQALRSSFMHFIFKHMTDPVARDYWSSLDWDTAPREEVARSFSMLVKMLKSVRTSAFLNFQRDANCSMVPRSLSADDLLMYKSEQKDKDKTLVEWHTRFSPVLQIALHSMTACVRADQLLHSGSCDDQQIDQAFADIKSSTETLLQFVFEFFGQYIAQPRRDLYEKATGLKPGQHSHTGFLTSVEAAAAAELARQHDFLRLHSQFASTTTTTSKGRGRGNSKGGRGRGGRSSAFKHLKPESTSVAVSSVPATPSQDTAPASSAVKGKSSAPQSSTSPGKGKARGRGGGNKK